MPALCPMLLITYYASNYAGIIGLSLTKAIRLVKLPAAKPRPLLISVRDELCKREILRSAYKLSKIPKWSNIYVSPDYTRKEREANKVLREELKRRKASGEVNLGIRNGRIVTKQPRPDSNRTDQMDASSGTNVSK